MAKLKFTLNKLAKNGFKFIEERKNYYTCSLQNNQELSFCVQDDEVIPCFKYSRVNGENPCYFTSIKSVISCLSNKL